MPEMSGLELLRALRQQGVQAPVIVITGHGDVPMAVAAMKEGASDFFEKPFDDEALLAAVSRALESTKHEPLESDGIGTAARERIEQLSARERQVLDGLLQGLPNKTIAYDLGISARTVEIYRAKVMTKMGASSFAELVRLAMQAGVSAA
jgi:two-component system response regulator FixJ